MPVLLAPEPLMAAVLKAVYNARNDLQGTLECRFRVDFFCGNVQSVRFLGHDAYSAFKHCASGYVSVILLCLYPYYLYICIYISHASLLYVHNLCPA